MLQIAKRYFWQAVMSLRDHAQNLLQDVASSIPKTHSAKMSLQTNLCLSHEFCIIHSTSVCINVIT